MGGRFVPRTEVESEKLEWGEIRWISRPANTAAESLVVMDVTLFPGYGHSFHHHPGQEEVITVVEGQIEQWIEQERRALGPGDSVFIAADTVHASFNDGSGDVRLSVVVGPAKTDAGYVAVDVFDEEPWSSLRP